MKHMIMVMDYCVVLGLTLCNNNLSLYKVLMTVMCYSEKKVTTEMPHIMLYIIILVILSKCSISYYNDFFPCNDTFSVMILAFFLQ